MSGLEDLDRPPEPRETSRERRRHRRSLKRRVLRWTRACWPFAFVAGAALLSAGVVRVVETGPQPPRRADVAPPDTPRFAPVDNLLDVDLFDQHFYWDSSRIDQARRRQAASITLPPDRARDLDLMGRETFLEDPTGGPLRAEDLSVEDAAAGREAMDAPLPSVDAGPASAPEPTSIGLLALGLGLLATRRGARAPTRTPRAARRRS